MRDREATYLLTAAAAWHSSLKRWEDNFPTTINDIETQNLLHIKSNQLQFNDNYQSYWNDLNHKKHFTV